MESLDLSYDLYENDETIAALCPIILIHGLFWNKFTMIEVAQELSQKTKRKVFALDMRNHGESPSSEHCDIFLMIEDTKKFIRDQGLSKVTFVCHSFSATIGYLIALEQPDVVEKIVMVDSTPFHECSQFILTTHVRPHIKDQKRLLNVLDPSMTLKEAKAKFYRLAEAGDKKHEKMIKKSAYELTKVKGVFKYKIDLDFLLKRYEEKAFTPEPRGSLNHEILIISCPNSIAISETSLEEVVKDNPNTKMVEIEGTTHLLMYEETNRFTDLVTDFLVS